MNFEPKNILLINFGQMGDVILSLPAMRAVREKFPEAKITALIGKSTNGIVEMSELFDEIISVDRTGLRKGKRLGAIRKILKLVSDIRGRKFDFVIDLHSLYETNLLGFFSGAKKRLYGSRANRSLDFLGNFDPKPPPIDRNLHLTNYYLQILKPLELEKSDKFVQIHPAETDLKMAKGILKIDQFDGKAIVGINLGAGNPSRFWGFDKFAKLAQKISQDENLRVLVFYGPEEKHFESKIKELFPAESIVGNKFNLQQLAAAFSYLKILIGNDTGPMHLAAIAGTPVVLVMDERAPLEYLPLSENVHVVQTAKLEEISVEDVFEATRKLL